jgi:hypothetical protein
MVDDGVCGFAQRRLGAVRDPEPGLTDHADVVCPIADGQGLLRREA